MKWFWASWATAGIAAETYALRHPETAGTLCETIRPVVTGPRVRRLTRAGWVGFATWFTFHIWR